MPKPLPIGIQSFADLITGGFLYVDKTRWIYEMVRYSKGVYFLSRPRRFGKSLLISTLEAIFKGKRHLFNGLWIDGSDYVWNIHPVIRIDFSQFRVTSPDELPELLIRQVRLIAEQHQLTLRDGFYFEQFSDLIIQLSSQGKVVVLVDEYDKPIMDNIDHAETAMQIRDILKGFYEVLKGLDEYLRFVFLTGVSKFSKVGVFSGLNHLKDITLDMRFGALLGMTQEEVASCFSDYLTSFSHNAGISVPELIASIRHWYDGFCFSKAGVHIYNPFSLLMLLDMQDFRNYWFETGTPTFLIRLLKSRQYDIRNLEDMQVDELAFSSYELDDLKPEALLVQTGYLTITGYNPESRLFRLSYPNFEVKNAFMRYLLDAFCPGKMARTAGHLWDMIQSLRARDMDRFFKVLQGFFAGIPYDIQIRQERYYQTVFYLIFKLMGLQAGVEVRTSRGRIDAVVELDEGVFLFEFKLGGNAETALAQMRDRGYAEPYAGANKPVHLIGAVFGTDGEGIVDWKTEEIS
ncbi:ATP-binding protein [Desulfatirhabdium butyrativorans]|uniref:ATP-binding protein n=1 Tax=Desulfatirhabdium butyrativorans TaxID=340467 RepID=UPI0004217D42|nr:ATP-binding protein [Desulfatirhabdium butyrativorans]